MSSGSIEIKRDKRRTSVITIGPDTVELCEPDCRNEFLADLGIRASRNGNYVRDGEATVTVAWSGKPYRVTWQRHRMNMRHCDLCADQWRYRIPSLVAKARRRSAAMKAARTRVSAPVSGNLAA